MNVDNLPIQSNNGINHRKLQLDFCNKDRLFIMSWGGGGMGEGQQFSKNPSVWKLYLPQ